MIPNLKTQCQDGNLQKIIHIVFAILIKPKSFVGIWSNNLRLCKGKQKEPQFSFY